ncbi:hypothetical protein NIES2101_15820 [Calothrix sp. HK-06]|nr:hypothetical protein NIES2101_15820 [Calothrix sp. HK-06]
MTMESDEIVHSESDNTTSHPVATSLGAVGGGVAGAAIGRSIIGGKVGAVIGGVTGVIAGSIAANKVAEFTEEAINVVEPTGLNLGANNKPIELPKHYTWKELQALSKPQNT